MKPSFFEGCFQRYGFPLALAAAFALPLKLTLAYAALIPRILLWLLRWGIPRAHPPVIQCFVAFVAVAFCSSLFGIEPTRSIPKFINLTFFSLSMLVFAELGRSRGVIPILAALVCGQLLASLHTVIDGAILGGIPKIFLGEVTESGQLGLQLPMAIGLTMWLAIDAVSRHTTGANRSALLRFPVVLTVAALNTLLAIAIGFSPLLAPPPGIEVALAMGLMLGMGAIVFRAWGRADKWAVLLIGIALPMLSAALLINLKRGPWLGTCVGLTVFLCIYGRAFLLPLLASIASALALVAPIRERILLSSQHFSIAGGRSIMWEIGAELASRFPLGIGYKNSRFLRHFSSYIPPSHTHFHNNALNILVETGWIGLGCFLTWILVTIVSSLSSRRWDRTDLLSCAIGCSIISWQVAGIVEYNFGDSEVTIMIWILLGLIVKGEAE